MKATLALENGIWYEGDAAGAPGETGGEVVFNTSMTRLPGNPDRPVLRRADRHDDGARDGQLRHVAPRTRESRGTQVAGFIVREESPVASNWRSDSTLRDYLVRNNIVAISEHRHARADARAALGRRDARHHRHRRRRSARAGGARAGAAVDGRLGPGARRHLRARVRLGAGDAARRRRVRAAGRSAQDAAQPARRRLRLRHEVEHPAPLHRLRLRRPRVSGDDAGVGAARRGARRRVPQQRPRRSGGPLLRDLERAQARGLGRCRCSASASATRSSRSRWAATPTS